MNKHILEKLHFIGGITPVNLATGANNGDVVSLKNFGRMAVVLYKGAGAAAEDIVIKVEQCSSVAASDPKPLNFTRVDIMSTSPALTALNEFTTVTQAEANSFSASTLGENEAIVVIDFKAEDLDVDNGFDCLRATIADAGTTSQIGGVLYIGHEPRYATVPMKSAIVD